VTGTGDLSLKAESTVEHGDHKGDADGRRKQHRRRGASVDQPRRACDERRAGGCLLERPNRFGVRDITLSATEKDTLTTAEGAGGATVTINPNVAT
jgi:hypothetical protein